MIDFLEIGKYFLRNACLYGVFDVHGLLVPFPAFHTAPENHSSVPRHQLPLLPVSLGAARTVWLPTSWKVDPSVNAAFIRKDVAIEMH